MLKLFNMKKLLLQTFLFLFGIITTGYSQICGGTFTDPAGATSNYANNSDYTVTISPGATWPPTLLAALAAALIESNAVTGFITRIALFPESAKYTFPAASATIPQIVPS